MIGVHTVPYQQILRTDFLFEDYETQSVTLRILDENDEKPQFLNLPHPFLAVVSSNAPPGTSVFQLIARDEDDLSEVNYFAESGRLDLWFLIG